MGVILLMKKLVFALILSLVVFSLPVHGEVSAQSAILIDARNGYCLYEKNADQKQSMASTTKIMTALITLEAAAVHDETVTITKEMISVEGSSMGLMEGYQLKLSDLAVGMLLASGNDAANAAAITLGGSLEGFSDIMNQKAAQIGMKDTHFVTPSGLDDDNHYTTARDMSILAMNAMQNPQFAKIAGSSTMKVQFLSPSFTACFENHNKLLRLYDDCTGIKTGFTKKSGRCLVSSAEKNGVPLIVVTLDDPNDWNDHIALLNQGFSQFTTQNTGSFDMKAKTVGGEKDEISVTCPGIDACLCGNEKVTYEIYMEPFIYAPVKSGDTVGKIVYKLSDSVISQCDIKAAEDCNLLSIEQDKPNIWEIIKDWFKI